MSIAGKLFRPMDRSVGQMSLLANRVPVFPLDGGIDFSAISSIVPSPGGLLGSGSSVIIDSSGSGSLHSFLAMGVYGSSPDAGVSQSLGSIDWSVEGPIVPGQSCSSPVVYLRNEGSAPVSLYLSTSGWVFRDIDGDLLSDYYRQFFSLSWDYDYSSMAVGEVRPVVFSLTISPDIVDVSTFSFDLVVTLTG
jgi:hypothetical protein